MRVLTKISFILLLTGLWSCSCNYHLRKARGKCGYTSDTVYKTVDVIVPKVETDTIFNYFQKDTVIIREGRLTMKYYYNTHDSTVFLSGKCDTVKVTKKVPVIVNKYKMHLPWWVNLLKWVLLFGSVGVGAILAYRRFNNQ